nr:MAG TPA: hypothetical protein [Caudoviricetes sp.]
MTLHHCELDDVAAYRLSSPHSAILVNVRLVV